jgi:hypothetical protein
MALSRAARLRLLDSRCFLEKRKRRLIEVAWGRDGIRIGSYRGNSRDFPRQKIIRRSGQQHA